MNAYEFYLKYAVVAQLAEQLICNQQVTGSSPVNGLRGPLAQLLEQSAHNRSVRGSSPRGSIVTFLIKYLARWLSRLERRPVTAEVVGSIPIRVVLLFL